MIEPGERACCLPHHERAHAHAAVVAPAHRVAHAAVDAPHGRVRWKAQAALRLRGAAQQREELRRRRAQKSVSERQWSASIPHCVLIRAHRALPHPSDTQLQAAARARELLPFTATEKTPPLPLLLCAAHPPSTQRAAPQSPARSRRVVARLILAAQDRGALVHDSTGGADHEVLRHLGGRKAKGAGTRRDGLFSRRNGADDGRRGCRGCKPRAVLFSRAWHSVANSIGSRATPAIRAAACMAATSTAAEEETPFPSGTAESTRRRRPLKRTPAPGSESGRGSGGGVAAHCSACKQRLASDEAGGPFVPLI